MATIKDLAEQYGVAKAQDQNENLGRLAEMLGSARDIGNEYKVPSWVPLAGGTGAGDLLMGKTPEEIENWSYGNAPMQIPEMSNVPQFKRGRAQSLADALTTLAPGVKATEDLPVGMAIKGYHGSPHKFKEFDTAHMGTGEGGQAYGWGNYITEDPYVATTYSPQDDWMDEQLQNLYNQAERRQDYPSMEVYERYMMHERPNEVKDYLKESYADYPEDLPKRLLAQKIGENLYKKQKGSHLYEVSMEFPKEREAVDPMSIEHFLDYDKPLSEQSNYVRNILQSHDPDIYHPEGLDYDPTEKGSSILSRFGSGKEGAQKLYELGIPGTTYMGEKAKVANPEGVRNFVTYSDEVPRVVTRNMNKVKPLTNEDRLNDLEKQMSAYMKTKRMPKGVDFKSGSDWYDWAYDKRAKLRGYEKGSSSLNELANKYNEMHPDKNHVSWDLTSDSHFDEEGYEMPGNPYVLIEKVYTHPDDRNKGVATRLMSDAMKEIESKHPNMPIKLSPIPLDKDTDIERLADFYKKFGFDEMPEGHMQKYAEGGSVDKDSLQLNKPQRTPSHPDKSHIVKTMVDGKEKIIRFGEQGAETAGKPKEGESDRMTAKRASFKARHAKNIAKGPSSAAYWANKVKWAEGGEVDIRDDEGYADDLARLKRAYENSNFGPNDSMIASTIRHPAEAVRRAGDWLQEKERILSGRPKQALDESSWYPVGIAPTMDEQAEAGLDIAGLAETGSMPFAPISAGGTLGTTYIPEKFVDLYKLFQFKEQNPIDDYPLFVNADKPIPRDVWVPAEAGAFSTKPGTEDKVKSGIGPLAYRPGYHGGDLPIATHIGKGGKPPVYRPYNHRWSTVQFPDDVDWQSIANERGINKKGKLIPKEAHITDQIPFGGHYRYKTSPNMTGEWLISGDMKLGTHLTDDEVKAINQASGLGVEDLPRFNEYLNRNMGNPAELSRVIDSDAGKAEYFQMLKKAKDNELDDLMRMYGQHTDEEALRAMDKRYNKYLKKGYAEGGSVDAQDDEGYLDDLDRLKKAYESSNFGPNDSVIASTIHHPIEAAKRYGQHLNDMYAIATDQLTDAELAAAKDAGYDEESYPLYAMEHPIFRTDAQKAEAGMEFAGLAQTGAMPFAPESAGGVLGSILRPNSQLGTIGSKREKKPITELEEGVKIGKRISTATPTDIAAKKMNYHSTPEHIITLDTMRSNPEAFEKNMRLMSEYMPFNETDTNKQADLYSKYISNNLKYFVKNAPEDFTQRSGNWYKGANALANDISNAYNIPIEASAGVLARLSPQQNWLHNVEQADRVVDIFTNHQNTVMPVGKYKGTKLKDLPDSLSQSEWIKDFDQHTTRNEYYGITPEGALSDEIIRTKTGEPSTFVWQSFPNLSRAVDILKDPSIENVSKSLGLGGHKIRNFYNNMADPFHPEDVTIDTHAGAAALFTPYSSSAIPIGHLFGGGAKKGIVEGSSKSGMAHGLYGLYADAYRGVAKDLNLPAQSLQSQIWELARETFPTMGKEKMQKQIQTNVLDELKKGKITEEEARDKILDIATKGKGFLLPDWYTQDYAKGGEVKDLHNKYEESDYGYGNRPDKTKKGLGYFGELERPDGTGVMTEYSIGVPIHGEEMDVPTLVPTLTPDEIRLILHMQDGEDMPRSIVHKAIDHAHQRLSEGKPIFATEEDLYAHGGIVDVLHNDAIEQIMKAFMDSMADDEEPSAPAVSIEITTQNTETPRRGKIPKSIAREAKHG